MDTSVQFPITDSVRMMESVARTNFHLSILLSTQSPRVHGAPQAHGGRRREGAVEARKLASQLNYRSRASSEARAAQGH